MFDKRIEEPREVTVRTKMGKKRGILKAEFETNYHTALYIQ